MFGYFQFKEWKSESKSMRHTVRIPVSVASSAWNLKRII